MKRMIIFALLALIVSTFTGCSRETVEPGHQAVKVNLAGSDKGTENMIFGPGRYWLSWNEVMYQFPTFSQNCVWTKSATEGSPTDESITFQSDKGLQINSDVGISYYIKPEAVPAVFAKYRKGIDEITSIVIRNTVRDAFVEVASTMPVEKLYGTGKAELKTKVTEIVRKKFEDVGIVIESISLVGDFRLPPKVIEALNASIEATQMAQQRENEVAQTVAEAKKAIEEAKGRAEAVLINAKSQAEANKILAASITDTLVQYELAKRWDGILPKMTGNAVPMVNLPEMK